MKSLTVGARRLPPHHITIRVPWHDGGWTGSVCSRPLDNTSCLILPRIGSGWRDEVEVRCASKRLDKLHARGIDYAYEQPLVLTNGRTRYPDFTIADDASGVTFYWEHLDMLDDENYKARWNRKRTEYLECGIGLPENGGGPERTLIETHDEPSGKLDSAAIALVIDEVILV